MQHKIGTILFGLAFGLVAFSLSSWLNGLNGRQETANLSCNFRIRPKSPPVSVPYDKVSISEIRFKAVLTNRSKHEDTNLWHGVGVASFSGMTRTLSGVTFTKLNGRVRAIGYWRSAPGNRADMLRIVTLNSEGVLDWNEETAYVYFDGDSDKLAHPFNYSCNHINQ